MKDKLINMKIVKCCQLGFWPLIAWASIGCDQQHAQTKSALAANTSSHKSAPVVAAFPPVSSLPEKDPFRTLLKKSGLCVYALETTSGNIVRASLDGAKITVLMETQIRNPNAGTEIVGPDVASRSGQTGYVSVRHLTSDNDKAAFLDSCIVDPKDPLWANYISLQGMCRSKAGADRNDSVPVFDLMSKATSGWVLVANYSYGQLEPGHWHEYVKSAKVTDGKNSLSLDQKWRFMGLVGLSTAIVHDGDNLLAWDLKKDKKYLILKARKLSLWRRDAFLKNYPPVVMRASIFDGNRRNPCLWKMKNPRDFIAKPEYLVDSSQLEPYSDLPRPRPK